MNWTSSLKKDTRAFRIAEVMLVAVFIGGLLWLVQAQHAALHIAERWVDARIAEGAASPADREPLLAAYRAAYTWQDEAGNERAYPVSRDSYYFLRLARNIIETGSPCPATPATDVCLDTQVNPVDGREMSSTRSPHPWGIALVYRVLEGAGTQPSMLRAGVLHNRLMLIVCGLLAYLLARRLAPEAPRSSGLAAAVMVILIPAVIQRSFGADNDVWVLALLLGGILATAVFLQQAVAGSWNVLALAATMAMPVVLYATWGGWMFLPILQCCAAVLAIAAFAIHRWDVPFRRATGSRPVRMAAALILAGIAVILARWFSGGIPPAPPLNDALPPPDAFAGVAELAAVDLDRFMAGLTWPALLAAAVGLAVAMYRLWRWRDGDFPAPLLLVLGWLAGVVILLFMVRYDRFLILVAPPIALLAALGIGAIPALLPRPAPRAVIAAGLSLALAAGVTVNAVNLVRNNRPQLHSAWVSVLDTLSQTTPGDAILVGWWNAGHWITYWARRTTAVDGASLQNPRIHDVGRLLATDAEGDLDALVNQAACGKASGCQRPVYLLTSTALLQDQAWMFSGFWQGRRAAWVDQLAADVMPADVPADLLEAARNADTPMARSEFAAPEAQIWSTGWSPCRVAGDNSYDCLLGVTSRDGWLIERLVVPGGRVNEAYLAVRTSPGESPLLIVPPSMVRIAARDQLLDVAIDTSTNNPGILLDTVAQRAFLGTPAVLHSLVARLVLLEGRYDEERFERVALAITVDGNKVSAWRALRN